MAIDLEAPRGHCPFTSHHDLDNKTMTAIPGLIIYQIQNNTPKETDTSSKPQERKNKDQRLLLSYSSETTLPSRPHVLHEGFLL